MTRGELRTRVRERLLDPEGIFLPTAEANATLDDACEVWAEEVGELLRTVFLPLQPGVAVYWLTAVAPDVMVPLRLWLQDRQTRLTAVDMRDLDARHHAWPTVSGEPEVWYPVGWDSFGVWPWPTVGGALVRVDYWAWPRPLLDDDDAPEWSEADHDALVEYGVYDGLAKRWEPMRMLEVWSRFQGRLGKGRGTNARRSQARHWQRGAADTGGLSHGVRLDAP